jgi:hypothetical protein
MPFAQHVQAEALPVSVRNDDHVPGLLVAVLEVEMLDVPASGSKVDIVVDAVRSSLLEPSEQERPETAGGVRVIDGDALERGAVPTVGMAERYSRDGAVDGQSDRQLRKGREIGLQGVNSGLAEELRRQLSRGC